MCHFGDHCFRGGVGKLPPVLYKCSVIRTSHTHSPRVICGCVCTTMGGWAVAVETVRCSKPKLFTLWFSTEKRCHLCCRKWTKLWGPGCVAYSLHSIHSLAQTGALCSVQVAHGLLRGRVSRAVSRQCNSGQGSGPGSDSPHRLHSRTQLQLELDGNQRQSGNVNIWAYLYRSVLVAGFDGKHHYPFFLPRSVLKW